MTLQPGERIDQYTIVQKLGHGGVSAQLGVPTWQVALIVIAVIVGLVTFGALIQILHGS